MNIASAIEGHEAARIALYEDDVVVSYGELQQRVANVRAGLATRGVTVGARVLIVGENEVDFVLATFAAIGLGAEVAPIRASNPLPEVERKASAVEPAVVVLCQSALWINDTGLDEQHPHVCSVAEAESEGAELDKVGLAERHPGDTAFLLLTSGVTSMSKVAVLSHGNLDWVQRAVISGADDGMRPDDVALGLLPLTHIFGLNVVLFSSLRSGGSIVLQQRFDPVRSMELIEKHQVTTISGAPAMWQRWVATDYPGNPLISVRRASSGAAALPIKTFNAVRDRFGIEIGEGYGLTETSPIVTWSRGVIPRAGSVGLPLEGVEIVIVEPDGTPVESGDAGEIVVRSPGVFQGYLDAKEATEQVLTADGWFWTGDMGVFDSDGFLYLVDRIKDIVIVSGFNVYPAEVESVIMQHPDVRGVIVVGTSDERTGEAVVAHVSGQVSVEELDEYCRASLSRYKCPSEFHLVDELPVSPNGKPLRRALRT